MSLSQALVFKCSSDNIQLLMIFIQVFGDKMESSKSLGFTWHFWKFCLSKNCCNLLGCRSRNLLSALASLCVNWQL